MIAATELRLVLVTPEKTLLDQSVKGLRFPLFDGQIGVLPGRAPLVGRLGTGELKIDLPSGSERYFIEGGFAQIKGSIVTLLTNRAVTVSSIDASAAEKDL
ncbi:MAG: F0F1 ATP synthase subunit epsilon [Planctomycetaceae bacterium]|nr:F0F1 ATP synthase subunit epsilon [Planctomycetaceae bacterium]